MCQCDGMPGKYLQNVFTSGMNTKSYLGACIFTVPPTPTPTAHGPFTATESDGRVLSCASSGYYNYAVNENPTCEGASKVISTVASIASVYSVSRASVISAASVASVLSASSALSASSVSSVASVSSAAAASAASWSAAATQPSAGKSNSLK